MYILVEHNEMADLSYLDQRLTLSGAVIRTTAVGGLPAFQNGAWLRLGGGAAYAKFTPADTTRTEFFMAEWAGIEASAGGQYFRWDSGATKLGDIRMNATSGKMEARVGSTLVATGSRAIGGNVKFHAQVHVKIDASGWIKLKLDDSAVLDIDYAGDTRNAMTSTDNYYYGNPEVSGLHQIDDLIFVDTDNSDGLGHTTWPGINYFAIQAIDGGGNYDSQFTQSTGSSARYTYLQNNDGDTNYLVDATAGHRQSVTTGNVTLPSNAVVVAQMAEFIARMTGGGFSATLFNRLSGSDDDGSAQALTTSYKLVRRWMGTKPGGGSWSNTDLNNNEIGVKVA